MPRTAVAQIREFLEAVEPDVLSTSDAADAMELFAEIERLGVAGKVLLASRAADSTKWICDGHRSAASWLAEKSGSTMGEAISSLETADRLRSLEKTSAALRRGELSFGQVKEVASAAEKDPTKEAELISAAGTESLKSLKARARKIRLRATSASEENARYRAIHAGRYCRLWNDEEGASLLQARVTPDAGARLAASLEAETNVFFDQAREGGSREQTQAYRADALVALVTGETRSCSVRRHGHLDDGADEDSGAATPSDISSSGESSGHSTRSPSDISSSGKSSGRSTRKRHCASRTDTVLVRVDAPALKRGHAVGDEMCEIAGVGPVPVSVAREILGDSLLRIVIRDAVDVKSVCHVGRTIPAHVRTALQERDPTCVMCDCAFGLEAHHWREDYAVCRTTSLDELARLCKYHHDLITYGGFRLTGGPGKWKLERTDTEPPDTS